MTTIALPVLCTGELKMILGTILVKSDPYSLNLFILFFNSVSYLNNCMLNVCFVLFEALHPGQQLPGLCERLRTSGNLF